MSVQRNEYQPIFAYLRSLNFHFLDTWVIECVNYYKTANPNISLDLLKNEVKQQWLLVNLREIKVPCLPADLKSKEKVTLNGNYAVQVESMIDSSVSCYSQFQKLLKVNLDDIEATKEAKEKKIKPKRCLTFIICDGVQELEAMEYQPISKIKTNDAELLPGFKMVIMGPVECRKGMILLKDENVRIFGGEVDTLTITNSLKNVLIKKLELDETDYSDSAAPIHVEKQENSENHSDETVPEIKQEIVPQDNFEDACVDTLLSQNDDVFLSLPIEAIEKTQTQEYAKTTQDMNESHFLEEEIHIWNENMVNKNSHMPNSKKHSLPEEELEMSNHKRRSLEVKENGAGSFAGQSSLSIEEDRDMFIDDFEEPPLVSSSTTQKKPVQTKLSSFFKNSDSSSSRVYRTSYHQKPVCVSDKPFVYLKQIMSVKLNKPTVFTLKAVILTLKKKITIENDEFHLKASITDGSASVDADFCSTVLEDLLGFSPCEMVVMLKAKQTNTAISQRVKESFSKAQEKLISLNCLMEIRFFTDARTPLILSVEEVNGEHLRALKERKLERTMLEQC